MSTNILFWPVFMQLYEGLGLYCLFILIVINNILSYVLVSGLAEKFYFYCVSNVVNTRNIKTCALAVIFLGP